MSNNFVIVVMAYNRPNSLSNVLLSLSKCIIEDDIPLIISIDGGGSPEVVNIATAFEWKHGNKQVVAHEKRLGLKDHFMWVGNLSIKYENILFIEDDLYVASNIIEITKQFIQFYQGDDRIAACSLYSPLLCEFSNTKFFKVEDGFDSYFLAHPYWGTIWMKDAWIRFMDWYKTYEYNPQILPENVKLWNSKSSFKKIFIQYLIETNRTCAFSRVSYINNTGMKGENNSIGLYCYQVPITFSKKKLRLAKYDESLSRYDAFFEIDTEILKKFCVKLKEYDFEVDLKQIRNTYSKEYVLTTRQVQNSIISFSDKWKPEENAVLFDVEGKGATLASTKDVIFEKNFKIKHSSEDIKKNYAVWPLIGLALGKSVITDYIRNKLRLLF